ncbi:MAG: AarF/UbiB family protein, partial [Candidatus Gastranaerophilales bacterium]|nr:AarF/UbiB family protein [Candidatus Gastranaerophilales bacterium]
CKYVILRGFDNITDNENINLLVDDFQKLQYLLNADIVYKQKYRCKLKTKVADKTVFFDLRSTGDNYYCEKWEEDIINNRIYDERGFYTPNKSDLLNTLIYHSIIHKKTVSHKYDELLRKLTFEIYNIRTEDTKNPYNIYNKILSEYMDKNDYYFIKPADEKVYYNKSEIRKLIWINLLETKYGFKNIEIYNVDKKPSSGFEFFFTSDYQNKKVFIKCGTGSHYAKKEYNIFKYLCNQNSTYFPESIIYRNLSDNRMFLCIECIQGETLSDELINTASIPKLNRMFNSLYEISEILFKNKFIHRDINYANLLVEDDGIIKLIDFQHLIGGNFKENIENIEFPQKLSGTNKRLRPFIFVWDDMYSIYHILKKFDGSKISDYNEKMAVLKSRIGKQRYFFFDNNFPLKSYFHFRSLIIFKFFNFISKPFRRFTI